MNNIQTNQNKPDFIRLLKAQRVAYSIAKRCMSIEVIILLISIIFPILLIFFPDIVGQSLVIILSGGLVIISVLLNNLMKNRTNVAAKIQEEFDTKLFNLNWNNLLCGSKVEDEIIVRLAKKYNEFDLRNWYSKEIHENLDNEIAVLLCQKTNLFWDKDLRSKYNIFLYFTIGIYYLIFFIIGYIKNLPFETFTIAILPSVTFLKYQIQSIGNQKEIIKNKERINDIINELLGQYEQVKELPETNKIREIQNAIFSLREKVSKVPDWFYKLYKDSFEQITDETIRMQINQLT